MSRHVAVQHRAFFPILLAMEWCDLIIGLTCAPRVP